MSQLQRLNYVIFWAVLTTGFFAVVNNKPILPCCITFHKPKGLLKFFKKKPCVHINFLEPYYITNTGNRSQDIERTIKSANY